MMIGTRSLAVACFALTMAALSAGACTEAAAIDEPCEADEDCADGLSCDSHGGEATCQEPHGHQGATSTSASTTTASGSGGAGGQGAGGAGGQGGGGDDPCTIYCGCLASTCASFDGYPHTNDAACMSSCEALSQEELTCWRSFCVQASEATVAIEHLCEHAWGADGLDECG